MRYRVSTRADDITNMEATRALKGSGLEQVTATYVQAFRLRGASHPYHVLTRRHSDQNWVLTTSKDLVTWTKARQLFHNPRWEVRTWPYVEVISDGWRTLHFAVTDGHPNNGIDTSLFHFRYRADDKVLRRSDGTAVSTPANPRSGTLVYDGRSVDGRVRVYDLALRSNGEPVIAMTSVDRDATAGGYA